MIAVTAKEDIVAHSSKGYGEDSARERKPIFVDVTISPFSLKRRSNPTAAFAEMMDRFSAATREDEDMARAFASFQKRFKGVILEQKDAVRLAALDERGAGKLGIKVGSWPPAIGPGLAFMYDAALEILRSSDLAIEPELIGPQAIRMVERSLDNALPMVGSMSVTAVELALGDKRFSDHLRQRASEIGTAYLDNPPGPCEYCEFSVKDKDGNITDTVCGTKDSCNTFGWVIIIILVLGLLKDIWDWLT
jgi:hypothetical protein